MFAENKETAILIAFALREDSLFANQEIIFRKYEKLKTYEILLNGLPVTDEYRFFFYKNTELCRGYYWHNAENINRQCAQAGIDLAHKVAKIIAKNCNFFVVDVAQKENGDWIVVELNHGTMSGLSTCDPEKLYSNLAKAIENDYKIKIEVSKPEFVGKMPLRTDLEVIPKPQEDIDAEIASYESFEARYASSPEFKVRIDAECIQWEKERQEFEDEYYRLEKEAWARGEATHMIPPHFMKPYPRPHDPRYLGWTATEMTAIRLGMDKIRMDKND